MKKIFCYFCLLALGNLMTACTQPGCTDPNAKNYNSLATKDDGSCIQCILSHAEKGTRTNLLSDNRSGSPYYGSAVVEFTFKLEQDYYNNLSCGEGLCDVTLKIKNLVPKEITFNYNIQTSFSPYITKNIIIGSGETVDLGSITTENINPDFCRQQDFNSIYIGTFLQGYVSYK